jgi:hypothetical protein
LKLDDSFIITTERENVFQNLGLDYRILGFIFSGKKNIFFGKLEKNPTMCYAFLAHDSKILQMSG